jgi:diguanylate cyclase (GGDEF)-like protein
MVTQPSVPKGLLSNDNFVEYSFEGVEKQAVWLPLENGMRLNVSVPVSEINSEWHSWAFNLALAFAILLVAAIIVTRRFANHITQPLQELTAVAEQVNEGNYDCSLTYNGDDEVGVLTHAFSRLIAHLKTYIHDLNDLAYADSLTSVHNKGAFSVSMNNLQDAIDKPDSDERFAIVIFDCDNLKEINDQYGHGNGNIYLKTSCSIICNAFRHSPVFRVGGDEFATILKGDDYVRREELLQMFDDLCEDKRRTAANEWEKVSISRGMAVYDPLIDGTSRSVASRADDIMYENKRAKKQQQ